MSRKITFKIIRLIILSALLPLIFFGAIAIYRAYATSKQTVISGNKEIAIQVAGRIHQYLLNAQTSIQTMVENIQGVTLSQEQLERIFKNYDIGFKQFRYLRLVSLEGKLLITSEMSRMVSNKMIPFPEWGENPQIVFSDVYMTDDLIPALTLWVPVKNLDMVSAFLVAEIDLLDLWNLVENLTIGKKGHLHLVNAKGQLFATGDGSEKIDALQMNTYQDFESFKNDADQALEIAGSHSRLIVGAFVPPPFNWLVSVEQPLHEAYNLPRQMTFQLIGLTFLFLLAAAMTGWTVGNREMALPLQKIMRRIREISTGQLTGHVKIHREGEFKELAQTLNQMSDDLMRIQKELVRSEKHALLGRIAQTLAHDLKHPVVNIENFSKLLETKYQDAAYRQLFVKTIKQEFARVHTFLENLRNLSKEIPHLPRRIKPQSLIKETIDPFLLECEKQNIELRFDLNADPFLELDVFSFQRVLSNLIQNAIEAMPSGGSLILTSSLISGSTIGFPYSEAYCLKISDTGMGIDPSRVKTLFEDFKTTKKTGLGLGLAITSKIIQQHRGWIQVESVLGQKTTFLIYLPVPFFDEKDQRVQSPWLATG